MSDLEDNLRAMLQERAGDVTAGPRQFIRFPDRPGSEEGGVPVRGPRRTGWFIAAAVAAVLLAATAATLAQRSTRSAPPARPATTPVPTPTPTPTVLSRTVFCTRTLPTAWRSAITAGTNRFSADSAFPLAVSADGRRLLATRDFGSARDVILVGPTGHPRRIYSVARPDDQQVVDGYLEGNYALLDVDHLPRNANGVLPTVRAIVLIDLRDNSAKVLDRTTDQQAAAGGRTIRRAVLWAGHVYWDVSPRFAGPHPVIRDYDIATGKTSDAGRTSFGSGPEVTAEGVIWSEVPTDAPAVARTLPQAVVTDRTASRSVLQTDGRAYAWATADRRIAWWDPDSAGVVVFRMPRGVAADVIGVAGRYVLFDDQAASNMVAGIEVLDTRSGVTAQLTDIQPFVLSGAGVVVAYRFTGAFKASRFSVVRFDTAALPELRC